MLRRFHTENQCYENTKYRGNIGEVSYSREKLLLQRLSTTHNEYAETHKYGEEDDYLQSLQRLKISHNENRKSAKENGMWKKMSDEEYDREKVEI